MAKGPWENRVGKLLQEPDFFWSHKCPDSPFHGGQPKIDWDACDRLGNFWMIEVKQISPIRQSFNLDSRDFISAGQIEALTAVARTPKAVSLLVVGRQSRLYIFDWKRLQWHWTNEKQRGNPKAGLVKLSEAHGQIQFTRWEAWQALPFYHIGRSARATVTGVGKPRIPRMKDSSVSSPSRRAASPSTLKRTGSTRTSPTPISLKKGGRTAIRKTKES